MTSSKKREREHNDTDDTLLADEPDASTTAASSTTNFRSVSACNRCRTRKNRCDQRLPRCTNCERAKVDCVGFDPVSKRPIPRNYVYYLETRVNNLEALLHANGIACPAPSEDFAISDAIMPSVPFPPESGLAVRMGDDGVVGRESTLDPALHEDVGGFLKRRVGSRYLDPESSLAYDWHTLRQGRLRSGQKLYKPNSARGTERHEAGECTLQRQASMFKFARHS
ncbi:hypothetical protein LTR74_015392 [Friedmanniomyces endolithicus]|nr:hypothetical protein LTR74_015392 [Friedmanniomyces endolithicus]